MADLSHLSDDELLALHEKAAQPSPESDLSKMSDEEILKHYYAAHQPMPAAKPEGIEGTLNAAMRGAAQGAFLGFPDEATAGVGGLYDYLQGKFGNRGDISLPDAYHTRRDSIRRADAKAQAEHPWVYGGSQAVGALGSAFAPGIGALNVGKDAGVLGTAVMGGTQGAIQGAGDAKEITDVPDEALRGAKWGAALGGGLNVAGKAASAVADKLKPAKIASVLLNAPEQGLERYIQNPAAVNEARPRDQIVQQLLARMENLKGEVKSGSQASRDILQQEGKTVSGRQIADIFDSKADQILKRSEGVFDDPQVAAAYKYLRDSAQKYRSHVPDALTDELKGVLEKSGLDPEAIAALGGEKERQLSTNRVKDLIQSLDKQTTWESAPGQFTPIDDLIRKDVRGNVDSLLKGSSDAYTKQMQKVASDSSLLNEVSDFARTPQGFDGLLKRTQRGNTPHQLDALSRFDKRTGGGLLDELQNSAVKDALNKGAMNGSRNELLHGGIASGVGEAIGGLPGKLVGQTLGLLGGASVDKYGPKMAKGMVDFSAKVQNMLSTNEGVQTLGKWAAPLAQAAQRGNQSLAATHFVLSQTDPNYKSMMDDDKVKPRLGE